MHLKFPKTKYYYAWEELSCLSRALGFHHGVIKECLPQDLVETDNGISQRDLMKYIDLKFFNDALDRSANMHTAVYNINVLKKSIELLNHRLLSFDELSDVRVAFQVYEAGDLRGMVIDQQVLMRTLKLSGRTMAPLKLMHRVKHMEDRLDEPGRLQLYEFLDLIVLCELIDKIPVSGMRRRPLDKTWRRLFEMDKYPHKSRESSGGDGRDRRNRERSSKESPRGVHSESPRNNSEKSYSSSKSRSKVYSSSSSRPGNNQLPPKSNSYTTSSTPETERKLKELLARANEWTMHTSSSGKKYYYNCKTEVSQWEKPKEWIEKEALEKAIGGKLPVSGSQTNIRTTPSKDRGTDKHSIRSRSSQSSQSQPYRSQDRTSSTSYSSESRSRQSSSSHSSSSQSSSQRRYSNSQSSYSSSSSRVNHTGSQSENSRSSGGQSQNSRSSGGQSESRSHHPSATSSLRPTEHRNSYEEEGRRGGEGVSSRLSAPPATAVDNNDSHHYDRLSPSLHPRLVEGNGANGPTGLPMNGPESSRYSLQAPSVATDMYGRLKNLVSPGGTSIRRDKNDSPKVNSTPSPHISTVSPLPTTSPKTRTPIESRQQGWRKSSSSSPVGRNHSDAKEETPQKFSNPSPMSVASVSDLSSYPSPESSTSTPLSNFASSQPAAVVVDSKPVESMEVSETKDVEPPDKDMDISDSPTNEEIRIEENKESTELSKDGPAKVDIPAVAVEVTAAEVVPPEAKPKEDDLQFENVVFSAESHSSYFSEDLIKDKINTPVEQLEKQAQLVQRDYYRLGFENYSQVMMDLKFARSLVRTTEIQANVQASRIVFLRQQVKELEKLKNENAYMT